MVGSLGSLGDGMLGELSSKDESDRGLDLSGRDGRRLAVRSEFRSLTSDPLEDVVNEAELIGQPPSVSRKRRRVVK